MKVIPWRSDKWWSGWRFSVQYYFNYLKISVQFPIACFEDNQNNNFGVI